VQIPGLPYTKIKSNTLRFVFVICFLSTLFSGIESMLMSVYLPVVVKDVLINAPAGKTNDTSAWINALFIFGWMFGGVVWGIVSDKIGRVKSIALSTACVGLFGVLTGLSTTWFLVAVCRFLSGFGIGGVLVTTVILIAEIWSGKFRAIIQGIVSLAMPVGFFAAGAINNLVADWRVAFWIGAFPLALSVVAALVLPESEKWKTGKLSRRAARNTELPGDRLFDVSYRKNLATGSVVFGAMLIGLWAVFSWTPTWVQAISAPDEVQQQRGLAMMALALGGIAGSFFSGWIVNAIGLHRTMLLCFAICFIMTFIVFNLNTHITALTFAEMGVLTFFFGISQGALAVYIPSMFPTRICATATGFCFNAGRLFTGTVVFFIGALVGLLGGYGNAIFAFSFVFVIGWAVTFFTTRAAGRKEASR
jgi:MFS family permease